jgi:DDE superfamily endonuclease.
MDNFSAHEAAVDKIRNSTTPLTNTLVIWLPPNTISKYQPLDQGIIRTWKAFWRREWVQFMLTEYDAGRDPLQEVNILIAIRWAIRAWNFDISEKTIINCFYRALALETRVGKGQSLPPPLDDIAEGITRLQQRSRIHEAMDIENFLNPDEELVQDSSKTAEELVLSQMQGPTSIEDEDEDADEGEGEAIPQVTISEALEAIRMTRLHEEQDEEGDFEAIQVLNRLERKYLAREVNSRRQGDIRSWFG